jgi:hypothetical protein
MCIPTTNHSIVIYSKKLVSIASVRETIFFQPAQASESLLDLNVVNVEGGPFVMNVTWQRGVLGVGERREEQDEFMRKVCGKLAGSLFEIAQGGS